MKKRAFTLIELLVVLAVIALLASGVLLMYSSVKAKSRDGRRMVDIKSVANALELYYTRYAGYPQSLDNLVPDYISAVPRDPRNTAPYVYAYTLVNSNEYSFSFCLETDSIQDYSRGCYTLP